MGGVRDCDFSVGRGVKCSPGGFRKSLDIFLATTFNDEQLADVALWSRERLANWRLMISSSNPILMLG